MTGPRNKQRTRREGAPAYVVVHNGSRDSYQVALALAEVGRLEALVTDGYSKSGLFKRRHRAGIPSRKVANDWPSVGVQVIWRAKASLLSRASAMNWSPVERRLGRKASSRANQAGVGVLAYSGGTAWHAFEAANFGRILFVFHPVSQFSREILQDDADRYRLGEEVIAGERDFYDLRSDSVALGEIQAADTILVASSFTARSIKSARGTHTTADVHVVPYGCPPIVRSDHPRTLDPSFLFVGQGVQRKGIHHLLRAWNQISSIHPSAKLTLVMATASADLLPDGLDPSVTVLPRVSDTQLSRLMLTHHVLVLPSLVEGYGLVINEALAHGMHVVATPNTGLPDLPRVEASSSIVPAGEYSGLAQRLEALCDVSSIDHEASYETALMWQWHNFRAGVLAALTGGAP